MARWLRALVAPAEDPGLVLGIRRESEKKSTGALPVAALGSTDHRLPQIGSQEHTLIAMDVGR